MSKSHTLYKNVSRSYHNISHQSVIDSIFNSSKSCQILLNQPGHSALADANYPTVASSSGKPEVAVLENGITVVTQASKGPLSTVSLFANSGSRFETPDVRGINNFFETAQLRSTYNRSDFRLVRETSKLGLDLSVTSSRDYYSISATGLCDVTDHLVGTVGDLVTNHEYNSNEIRFARQEYLKGLEHIEKLPDAIVNDNILGAAYSDLTVGAPTLSTPEIVNSRFSTDFIENYFVNVFNPKNIVVSFFGPTLEQAVDSTNKYFSNRFAFGIHPEINERIKGETAVYTGGDRRVFSEKANGLTHVAVGFQGPSFNSGDVYAASVLQTILGGGDSFSTGGPGKGMYSRLFADVLNKHSFVENVSSFNYLFADTGLFGVYGAAPDAAAGQLASVLCHELKKLTSDISEEELVRAKNMLKSSILFPVENKASKVEDAGRQLLIKGDITPLSEVLAQIDAVTVDGAKKVAAQILSSKPTFTSYGASNNLPTYGAIENYFA